MALGGLPLLLTPRPDITYALIIDFFLAIDAGFVARFVLLVLRDKQIVVAGQNKNKKKMQKDERSGGSWKKNQMASAFLFFTFASIIAKQA